MNVILRNSLLLLLALASPLAQSQSPYAIHGLRTGGEVFDEALALAQRLGGQCERGSESGVSAQCDFRPCARRAPAGDCREWDEGAPSPLAIAGQPVLRIGIEAAAPDAPLSRVVILYDGDPAAVAAELSRQFGPSDKGDAPGSPSWTHSGRLAWSAGPHRMGLLDTPRLLILATE